MVSTLMKLAGGSPSLSKELNIDAFLAQARPLLHAWCLGCAVAGQLSAGAVLCSTSRACWLRL